jgi:dolichyl-phosphate-mannose--protein O-mannosyl transferase
MSTKFKTVIYYVVYPFLLFVAIATFAQCVNVINNIATSIVNTGVNTVDTNNATFALQLLGWAVVARFCYVFIVWPLCAWLVEFAILCMRLCLCSRSRNVMQFTSWPQLVTSNAKELGTPIQIAIADYRKSRGQSSAQIVQK